MLAARLKKCISHISQERRMLKIRPSVGQLNFEENDKPITLIVDASGLTNYIKQSRLHRGEMDT
jgi:hypothetical protein